jgi:hypothetical protein
LPHQLQVSPRLVVKWRLARRQEVQYLVRQVVITRPLSMKQTLGVTTDSPNGPGIREQVHRSPGSPRPTRPGDRVRPLPW